MKLFEDGDPFFAPMLNALFAAFRGTAVMSGCEVSATGTSRTVSITAGSVQINGEVIAVSAGSVTLDAGSTFDRYDLVSVNASGSKIVTKGTTKRKCPTQPANTCLLAIVFVPAGATVIATGNVYDARMDASYLWIADPGLTKPRYIDNRYVESHTTSWVTAKTTPAAKKGVLGTATIYYDISTPSISGMTIEGDVRLLKNDVVVPNSEYTVTNGRKFITIDVPVTTGDIFKLQIKSYFEDYGCYTNVFGIYALMTPIIDENKTWS